MTKRQTTQKAKKVNWRGRREGEGEGGGGGGRGERAAMKARQSLYRNGGENRRGSDRGKSGGSAAVRETRGSRSGTARPHPNTPPLPSTVETGFIKHTRGGDEGKDLGGRGSGAGEAVRWSGGLLAVVGREEQ